MVYDRIYQVIAQKSRVWYHIVYMKVFLLRDVVQLGKKGDITDVSEGYARNFLIPKGLVEVATASTIQTLTARKKKQEKIKKQTEKNVRSIHATLHRHSISLSVRVGESGTLYSAISPKQISESVHRTYGITLEVKRIRIAQPIKSVGTHHITITCDTGLVAEMSVRVSGL